MKIRRHETPDLIAALGGFAHFLEVDRGIRLDQDVLRQAAGRRPLPELLASAYQPDTIVAELRRRGIEPLA
jgi:hypothetical protein